MVGQCIIECGIGYNVEQRIIVRRIHIFLTGVGHIIGAVCVIAGTHQGAIAVVRIIELISLHGESVIGVPSIDYNVVGSRVELGLKDAGQVKRAGVNDGIGFMIDLIQLIGTRCEYIEIHQLYAGDRLGEAKLPGLRIVARYR